MNKKELGTYGGCLVLSVTLILFTQWIKTLKYPDAMPITMSTIGGLLLLGTFAFLGILLKISLSNVKNKTLRDFPVLGWVSIISLIICLIVPKCVELINNVDFLSITTPVLTFAGISVANRLTDLKNISWKVVIVGIFVFLGTYLGSATLSQIALKLSGAI
ncbi:MAG: hypothetical protein Q4Q07_03810 [Tissierellia bacterium]|nr:hypothetical protein [Tissierellia bacterium]